MTLRATVRYTVACAWIFVALLPALYRHAAPLSSLQRGNPLPSATTFPSGGDDAFCAALVSPAFALAIAVAAISAFCASQAVQNKLVRRLFFGMFVTSTLLLWITNVIVGDYSPQIAGLLSGMALIAVVAVATPDRSSRVNHELIAAKRLSNAVIRNVEYNSKITRESQKREKHPLSLARYVIFYFISLAGFAIIACDSENDVILLDIFWLCLSLLAANALIWPLAQIPEWLGYTERRRCFIDRRAAIRRNIAVAIAAGIGIAAIALTTL